MLNIEVHLVLEVETRRKALRGRRRCWTTGGSYQHRAGLRSQHPNREILVVELPTPQIEEQEVESSIAQ